MTEWVTTNEVLKATWLTARQFTFYKEEAVCPKGLRAGTNHAVYPACTIDLLQWVAMLRVEDVPLKVIKEFIPVWHDWRENGFGGMTDPAINGLRFSFWWPSMWASIRGGAEARANVVDTATSGYPQGGEG